MTAESRRRQTTVQRQLGGFLNAATSERLEYDTGVAFSEKLEWARRLERIEVVKAEERMKSGKPLDPSHNYDKGRTDDVVAQKSGFGSRNTYGKAKFIAEYVPF